MMRPTPEPPWWHWLAGSWAIYAILSLPASVLAYIGFFWAIAPGLDVQTRIAAGALVAAWFSLAVGAYHGWTAAGAGTRPSGLSKASFFLVATLFYAVAFTWGGRMLI